MEDLPPIVPGLAAMGGAGAEAALARGEPFVVTIDDVEVRVEYTGGTTPTVFLSAPYAPRGGPPAVAAGYREYGIERIAAARPLMIELSLENEDDRRAKRTGVSREVQTGDAAFDRGVYEPRPPRPSRSRAPSTAGESGRRGRLSGSSRGAGPRGRRRASGRPGSWPRAPWRG